jgi:branched-chain amino acid transport system permease protein
MLQRVLSADMPRSRWLALLLVLLVAALALTPFIFPGVKALNVAAKVLVFIVLVASFDLLLGYTGIVSFAHTMFFGIGAYGIAIATTAMGPTWSALAVGLGGALLLSFALALLVGLFSLRVRAIFFAMITPSRCPKSCRPVTSSAKHLSWVCPSTVACCATTCCS